MPRALKALGLAAVVAAAVMVPLYGDPRAGSLKHPEWARMLLGALDLEENLPPDPGPALVFSILSWKNSLAYPADRYLRARGTRTVDGAGGRQVVAAGGPAEVAYPLTVVRTGDYRLRAELAGDPGQAAAAEIIALGETRPVREFTLVPPPVSGWVDAGAAHLRPGAYTAALTLPAGATLRRVEVVPPCLGAVEPAGGWRAESVVQAEDVAVTALQALELQSELPPAAAALELTASDFRPTGGMGTDGPATAAEQGLEGLWLKGGFRGVQALILVDLREAGLYTLFAFGLGGAQGWLIDSCQKAILCPSPDARPGPAWRPVVTVPFTAGRHSFVVTLPPGAALGRVRLERKKDEAADYMATLARLGFDVGAPGPLPRGRALEAARFVEERGARLVGSACGEVPPPGTLEAGLAEPALPGGPAGPRFSGQPPSGVGVPLVVPPVTTPPASPTVPPVVTTPPVATPPPSGPPPTTPPPPPTVPPQPPGSPVTVATPPPPGA